PGRVGPLAQTTRDRVVRPDSPGDVGPGRRLPQRPHRAPTPSHVGRRPLPRCATRRTHTAQAGMPALGHHSGREKLGAVLAADMRRLGRSAPTTYRTVSTIGWLWRASERRRYRNTPRL